MADETEDTSLAAVTEVVGGENTPEVTQEVAPKKSRAKAKPAASEDLGELVEFSTGISFFIRK